MWAANPREPCTGAERGRREAVFHLRTRRAPIPRGPAQSKPQHTLFFCARKDLQSQKVTTVSCSIPTKCPGSVCPPPCTSRHWRRCPGCHNSLRRQFSCTSTHACTGNLLWCTSQRRVVMAPALGKSSNQNGSRCSRKTTQFFLRALFHGECFLRCTSHRSLRGSRSSNPPR